MQLTRRLRFLIKGNLFQTEEWTKEFLKTKELEGCKVKAVEDYINNQPFQGKTMKVE